MKPAKKVFRFYIATKQYPDRRRRIIAAIAELTQQCGVATVVEGMGSWFHKGKVRIELCCVFTVIDDSESSAYIILSKRFRKEQALLIESGTISEEYTGLWGLIADRSSQPDVPIPPRKKKKVAALFSQSDVGFGL